MSKDIRSFFTIVPNSKNASSSTKNTNTNGKTVNKKGGKRPIQLSSGSDNEDPIPKPLRKESQKKTSKKKRIIDDSSDDDVILLPVKKPSPKKPSNLKALSNVSEAFGAAPVARSNKRTFANKRKADNTIEEHEDESFEATLNQLDRPPANKKEKIDVTNMAIKLEQKMKAEEQRLENEKNEKEMKEEKTKEKEQTESLKEESPLKTKLEDKAKELKSKSDTPTSKIRTSEKQKTTKEPEEKSEKVAIMIAPPQTPPSAAKSKLPPKTPEELQEQKRKNAQAYFKYQQRGGPKNAGSKEIPEGAPDCLKGMTFVTTGVLDSLEREEAEQLIKRHGGRVTHSISKVTTYVVVGDDPGEGKLNKAKSFGTKLIDEDNLLDMIRQSKKEDSNKEDSKKERDNKQKVENKTKKEEKKTPTAPSKTSESSSDYLLWVDKYKPTSSKNIIGQQGDRSCANKLIKWLQNWHKNNAPGVVKKKPLRPGGFTSALDDGSSYKAALLSGPPGIGKTTTAHLVCKELGFDVVEFNASDTRSKKALHEEVSQLLTNKSIVGLSRGGRHALLMDEVDGMAGNEDRGGVQELIQLMKISKVPIICMCNDRSSPKIRSLSNYCFDLRFNKPRIEQIKGAMMSIIFREGLSIKPDTLTELISSTNQDIRQVMHHLSLWSADKKAGVATNEKAKEDSYKNSKDLKMGPWDVLRKVFDVGSHKNMSLKDKSDLFFHDYSLAPLFVQENYLKVIPMKGKDSVQRSLELVSEAADSLRDGDICNRVIQSQQQWSLLPTQAMFSSVIPGSVMEGYVGGVIEFPTWFGKNSKQGKINRLLAELTVHMRTKMSGNKLSVGMDYSQLLRDSVYNPLIQKGMDGVGEALGVVQSYCLLREDLDSLVEVAQWPHSRDVQGQVDSKVKSAFTRMYNKDTFMLPYTIVATVKKKRGGNNEEEEGEEDEGNDEMDEEEEEDLGKDAMIKVKTKKTTASTSKASSTKPKVSKASSNKSSPSQGGGKGKGKGKASKK